MFTVRFSIITSPPEMMTVGDESVRRRVHARSVVIYFHTTSPSKPHVEIIVEDRSLVRRKSLFRPRRSPRNAFEVINAVDCQINIAPKRKKFCRKEKKKKMIKSRDF